MDQLDTRIELALCQPKPPLGDDGFSDHLMGSLPRRRVKRATARRLTLGGAAIAGSILTSVMGAPLEAAFSAFVLDGGAGLATLTAIGVVGIVALSVAWVFYSR